LIGRRVSKKYPGEIVVVKFGMSFACFLGAQARSKNPEAWEVEFVAVVTFKRSTFGF
jgi:hypothetical protein